MSNLLDDLKLLQAYMDTHPVIQAVWCIDRPHMYRAIQAMLLNQGATVDNLKLVDGKLEYIPDLTGVSLLSWSSGELESMADGLVADGWTPERITRLYPFREPGVWVQMSNNKHYELIMESTTGWVMKRVQS